MDKQTLLGLIKDCAEGSYHVEPQIFRRVRRQLDENRYHYDYDESEQLLNIRMPSVIHGECCHWIDEWLEHMHTNGLLALDTWWDKEVSLDGMEGPYKGDTKTPDAALLPGQRIWPTITMETIRKLKKNCAAMLTYSWLVRGVELVTL